MKLLLACATLISLTASAAPLLQLDMRLSRDGRPVATPRILVEEGHTASVESDGYFVEVTPTREGGKIRLKCVTGLSSDEGVRNVVNRSELLVREGIKASTEVGRLNSPRESVSLEVVARRSDNLAR